MLQEEESHVEFSCNVTSNFNRKLKFLFIVEAGLLLDRNSQNTFKFLLCFVSKLNWYLLLCSAVFLVKVKPIFFFLFAYHDFHLLVKALWESSLNTIFLTSLTQTGPRK